MSATMKITATSPRPNQSMASTATMTTGMVMPTQRSGSRNDAQPGSKPADDAQ